MARTLFVISLGAALVACGSPDFEPACNEACEFAKECGLNDDDCVAECKKGAAFAERSGCDDDLADLYECMTSEAECTEEAQEVCQSEGTAALVCVLQYCSDNPDDDDCFGGSDETDATPD